MTVKTNRDDAIPFITKDESEIREIMAPANSVIKNLSLAEATLEPGASTKNHIHKTVEEIYYILVGKGKMTVGDETFDVRAGDAIAHEPGVPHKLTNTGEIPLVFLCICTPYYTHDDTELLE